MSRRAVDLIAKKKEGLSLQKEEIEFLVNSYVKGQIPDYQMAAFLMAVYFRGLNPEETANLTMSMAYSGETFDLSEFGFILDKHSTGGVGDTTTLVVLPLVAACGGKIAKLSGRGLGHTGGTIDKLESISGFNTELSETQFFKQVKELGVVVAGQTKNLVPADKLLYALRDVTATVDSLPLIAASIMSKKIAGGADGIVLDVKVGRGAFMKDIESARDLARLMVKMGNHVGRKVTAVISDMETPLSLASGNKLEVLEALEVLKGKGSKRLRDLSLVLAQEMLYLAEIDAPLEKILQQKEAYKVFEELVSYQGGDLSQLKLEAAYQKDILALESGYFVDADALQIGEIVCELGAGRKVKEDSIDPDVGVYLHREIGDKIQKGEPLATVYANDKDLLNNAIERLQQVLIIGDKPSLRPVVYEIIRDEDLL